MIFDLSNQRHQFGVLLVLFILVYSSTANEPRKAIQVIEESQIYDQNCNFGEEITLNDDVREYCEMMDNEIEDPDSLQVKLSVQGDLRQNYNTCDMAHKIPEVIEWVSWVNTLEAGDVISCGTNHLELGPLQDGDRVEMEISDFGKLVVNVSDDLKRTWPRETRAQREARLNS